MNDKKCRKFLLTINESDLFGPDHDEIRERLSDIDIIQYWCMCDEINRECNIYHTHLFILFDIPVSDTYIMKKFSEAHIEYCIGSFQECVDYIRKQGKFRETWDNEENLSYTFEDSVSCSDERPVNRKTLNYDIVFLSVFSVFYFFGFLGLIQKYLPEDFLQLAFIGGIVFLIVRYIVMGVKLWKIVKVQKLLAKLRKRK